jgi:hypothetical protein
MSLTQDAYWDRLLFTVRLYRVSGDAFQSTVSQIFEIRRPGFQSIAPWGNWGDGGNDGWIEHEGHYFQIYGPKATTVYAPFEVVKKAITDFTKLGEKWSNVRRYSFVLNDRFEGIPAPVASSLQQLATDYSLEHAVAIGSSSLLQEFMELTRDQKMMIVGGIPSTIPDFVDANAVGDLLSSLADNIVDAFSFLPDSKAPLFDEKIEFNGLTSPVSDRLRSYSYQTSTVDDFLDRRDLGLKQAISQEIKALYEASKAAIPSTHEDAPNLRYGWMMEQLIPIESRKHPHSLKAYREAAQIVIAKYFETCDAYDQPTSATA